MIKASAANLMQLLTLDRTKWFHRDRNPVTWLGGARESAAGVAAVERER